MPNAGVDACPGVINFIQSAEYGVNIQPDAMETYQSNQLCREKQWNTLPGSGERIIALLLIVGDKCALAGAGFRGPSVIASLNPSSMCLLYCDGAHSAPERAYLLCSGAKKSPTLCVAMRSALLLVDSFPRMNRRRVGCHCIGGDMGEWERGRGVRRR